jgi:CDP-diacylglycerol pyrophosphatase
MRPSVAFLCLVPALLLSRPADAEQRGLLWHVVQTCLLNHQLTGAAFPCLSVETNEGLDKGYAMLRAPNDDVRLIVTPTVRTVGIESDRVRGPNAPDYFQDAWAARRVLVDNLPIKPSRSDLALAVNSRPGRSQDQLHIHVACIRPDVQDTIAREDARIRSHDWSRIKVLPYAPTYQAHYEPADDLSGINVFDRVAAGLRIRPADMEGATIVVVGAKPTGFIILARTRLPNRFDEPHGEGLLDPGCAAFRKS